MTFDNIVVEQEGPLLWLTLNRPAEANALSDTLADEFCAAIELAQNDPDCHVVILQGNGKYFCAGGDVHMMAAAQDPARFLKALAEKMHEGLLSLAHSRLITIAAVHGFAAGAGLGLVLNADFVLASDKAGFVSAYGNVGLSPDCGVSYLLPQIVGHQRAAQICLLGRPVTAEEGLAWGLVSELVPAEELVERARALGTQLTAGATQALGPTRQLLKRASNAGFAAHLALEAESISSIISHPDTNARIRAFVAKSTA
ncbi:enoyl-CoA hydratase/isomerase family protein [Arthrobacter psychrochitiniphilus]|uniref:enoyl-CoA hydratase/isomerase family protein n=1 Tax=Arthrobacter psychrochitiniphilus TaxID=291045 RepID=UPI003F7CCB44